MLLIQQGLLGIQYVPGSKKVNLMWKSILKAHLVYVVAKHVNNMPRSLQRLNTLHVPLWNTCHPDNLATYLRYEQNFQMTDFPNLKPELSSWLSTLELPQGVGLDTSQKAKQGTSTKKSYFSFSTKLAHSTFLQHCGNRSCRAGRRCGRPPKCCSPQA